MFEEIKNKISVIEKKLGQENTPTAQTKHLQQKEANDNTITSDELFKLLQKTIIVSNQKELQQILPQLKNLNKEVLDRIEDLHSNLKNLKCYPRKIKKPNGTMNLKLWKIFSIIICTLLLFAALALHFENSRLTDNDLKFRYIHSMHGINSIDLQNLKTIFHVNRDEEVIKRIRNIIEKSELKAKNELKLKKSYNNPEP